MPDGSLAGPLERRSRKGKRRVASKAQARLTGKDRGSEQWPNSIHA